MNRGLPVTESKYVTGSILSRMSSSHVVVSKYPFYTIIADRKNMNVCIPTITAVYQSNNRMNQDIYQFVDGSRLVRNIQRER